MSEVDNIRRLIGLLSDDGFIDALTNAEELVKDADETLGRVERIEGEANEALREANEALDQVDHRLRKFDETVSLLEAKIEAGFSVGFFFFALSTWRGGDVFLAAGLFLMGLLGASSLVVTVVNLPQVRRLRQAGRYTIQRLTEDESETASADEKGRGS